MRIEIKLAILELIGGIFGWTWILASVSALYFFVMAIGFSGAWSRFFWALGASAVAKWLAVAFESNKNRIALENNSTSDRTKSNSEKAQQRISIISDYGRFLEQSGSAGEIRDTAELPHAKDEILDAIYLELVREDDEQCREQLKVGALFLADFQDGVRAEPMTAYGIPNKDFRMPKNDDELMAMAERMANNPDREKYDALKARADADLADIQAKLGAAEEIRRQMPGAKRREILG
jgi:hypothetical protein